MFLFLIALLLVFSLSISMSLTGKNIDESKKFEKESFVGPDSEEIDCMRNCVFEICDVGDDLCMKENSNGCKERCGVTGPPEPENQDEKCMQDCILIGCDELDFECQEKNKFDCEERCGLIKEELLLEEMSEEQKCIYECIMKKDPDAVCENGPEGEKGDKACKKCAKECEHLYEGPCLSDKEIREKEKECEICKYCYGEPIMGDSGQGWECIVNVECKDASNEWGDEPGEGPSIGEEGYFNKENVFEKVGNFFKGLFGKDDSEKNLIQINSYEENELPIEEEFSNPLSANNLPEEISSPPPEPVENKLPIENG